MMHEWHDDDCDLEFRGLSDSTKIVGGGARRYWCNTHGQWACDFPIKLVAEYDSEAEERYQRIVKNPKRTILRVND